MKGRGAFATLACAALVACGVEALQRGELRDDECTFTPDDSANFPYEYRRADGTTVMNGTLVSVNGRVPGYGEENGTVCIFATDACQTAAGGAVPRYANGTAFQCCSDTTQTEEAANTYLYPLIAFFGPYFVFNFIMRIVREKRKQAHIAAGKDPKELDANHPMKGMFPSMSGMWTIVLGTVFMLAITAIVVESVIMPKSIQVELSPPDRAAQLAMSSFLTPFAEIFAFLEDTMVVLVGYAVSSMRTAEMNALLHIGIVGGAVSAIIAIIIALLLAFLSAPAAAILNPSSTPNDALIDGGCSLIPSTAQLLEHARTYWVLSALSWFPKFTTLSVFGFLTGTGQIIPQLLALIVQGTVPIITWFTLLGTDMPRLSILGVAYGLQDWVLAFIFLGYFVWNRPLRDKFNLRCVVCRCCSRRPPPEVRPEVWKRVFRQLLEGGVQVMLVDVAIQASLTGTIYIAASQHMETAYKLAAAQAAYWTFGPQYLTGSLMILKILGARLIAAGRHKGFIGMYGFVAIVTTTIAISAVLAAVTHRVPVAHDFGQSACVFASTPGCAQTYAAIFSGGDALQRVFEAFGPTVGLQLYFIMLRAGLAACHDFSYMWRAAVASVIIVYIPTILVARLYFETAVSYYVAMYAPHFAMGVLFGVRMWGHIKKLYRGEPGPWTEHIRRSSSATRSNSEIVPTVTQRLLDETDQA